MAMFPDAEGGFAFHDLLYAAVTEIVRHEDYDRLVAWLRDEAPRRFPGVLPPGDAGMMAALAAGLGRAVWNATPLPGNGFRPRPRPAPGRNDPCPCGSGHKYKHCCAGLPEFPVIEAEEMWGLLAEALPADQFRQAIMQRRIPPAALVHAAGRLLEEGHPRRAADLLEPIFAGPLGHLDERFEPHLDLLCDIYGELGHPRKKQALLERMIAEGPRPLAGAAWQRLAAVRADAGDREGCWEAFRNAQRTDPANPALSALEVSLLMSEGKTEMASQRAAFWLARLRRSEEAPEQAIDFLESVARDAGAAFFEVGASFSGAQDSQRLVAWLADVAGRPLPAYDVVELEAIDGDDPEALTRSIADMLRSMGLPQRDALREARKEAKRLLKEREKHAAAEAQGSLFGPEDEPEPEQEPDERPPRVLRAPEALAQVEQGWREVFPFGKPFSVDTDHLDAETVWAPHSAEPWLAYLERHPQCYDSLDILDDLAAAIAAAAPAGGWPGAGGPAAAVVARGCAILRAAVGEADARLEWAALDNRPGLRLLSRSVHRALDRDDADAAYETMSLLLRLNPNDNHGYRALAMNHLLRRGEDEAALALAVRYPEDHMPQVSFGQVLALYRRGDLNGARQALAEAERHQQHVARCLCKSKARRPRHDPLGFDPSGEEVALFYREEMRDTWAATPGLLDWLGRESQWAKGGPKAGATGKRGRGRGGRP